LCCSTFSGVIAPGDATAAGAEALYAVAPKSGKKNILRFLLSQKNMNPGHDITEKARQE